MGRERENQLESVGGDIYVWIHRGSGGRDDLDYVIIEQQRQGITSDRRPQPLPERCPKFRNYCEVEAVVPISQENDLWPKPYLP